MANFINYPQYLLSQTVELIFPKKCVICRRFNDSKFKGYLCKKCFHTIPVNHGFECIGCKRPSSLGKTCNSCIRTNSIDQILIAADYKNRDLIKIIKLFKYRFIEELGLPLFLLTKKYLIQLAKTKKFNFMEENPILLSVPLNSKRLNWRGFNQSDILAGLLSANFQIEQADNVITRIHSSKPQAEIEEKSDRLNNIGGIFKIIQGDKIAGRNILLVDDVCTTGATLNECARVLKQNGAKKVTGLVIARG